MITSLIFDADGVLVTGEAFSERLARHDNVDRAKVDQFFATKFQDCLVGEADLKEVIAPYLTAFGWTGTVDGLLHYWFAEGYTMNQPLIDYIARLRASGIRVVMATNQEEYRTQYILEQMGFAKVFDTIYASARLGAKKPSAEFFERVVDDMQAAKTQVLFWDDDQRNVTAALQYGIHAELYGDYSSFSKTMEETYGLHA